MISFSNINKQYGKQLVFVDAEFQLNPGEKVGLVGPNGSGKTTLFRMVVGEETPDEGNVSVPKKLTIGYFRQDVEEMKGRSVLDEAIAGSGRAGDLHHELEDLQRVMEDPKADDMDRILERLVMSRKNTRIWAATRWSRKRARSCMVWDLKTTRLTVT
jgi:ATPase subunit of ABC transporter with duplicated ATPase domains